MDKAALIPKLGNLGKQLANPVDEEDLAARGRVLYYHFAVGKGRQAILCTAAR